MFYIFEFDKMISISKLIWDDWNVGHIKKHNVKVEEVEEVCKTTNIALSTYEKRLIILGETTKGKLITIILSPEDNDNFYVVTARDMSKIERKYYDKNKNNTKI